MREVAEKEEQCDHLIIAVHGIRTYNAWQVRLHELMVVDPKIQFYYHSYGYFSWVLYSIPVVRWIEMLRFRKHLLKIAGGQEWARIDIVAHSFGTYIATKALRFMSAQERPAIHTLILSGSVLRARFRWNELRVRRVVNDCGIRDTVLVLNQLFVPLLGMAGRVGFYVPQSDSFRNRYFDFGHDGYFKHREEPSDHMEKQWVPLLLLDEPTPIRDCRKPPTIIQGVLEFVLRVVGLLKLPGWIVVLVLLPCIFILQPLKSISLAAQAEQMLPTDRSGALGLALRSKTISNTDAAQFAVADAFPQPITTRKFGSLNNRFSPGSQRVLIADSELSVPQSWNPANGAVLTNPFDPTSEVKEVALSPDRRRLIVSRFTKDVTIETVDGRVVRILKGHTGAVYTAEFSPDGTHIVTAGADATARIWDASNGELLSTLRGHRGPIVFAAFSPDEKTVVTASADWSVRLWDVSDGHQLAMLVGHHLLINSGALSPDGWRLVTASQDHTARVWDLGNARLLTVLQGHTDIVNYAAFAPDGKRIITASDDSTARVWNASTGESLMTIRGHDRAVEHASFSPDGRWIVTTGDQTARVWSAKNGELFATVRGQPGDFYDAAFSQDSLRLITSGVERSALWDLGNTQLLITMSGRHDGSIAHASFSPDGRRIVTAALNDRVAKVWDVVTGRPLATLRGHTGGVNVATFSSDGARIVTASVDGTLRVWNENGEQLATLNVGAGNVTDALFSPNGQQIVTSSEDNTARIWNVADGRVLATLRGHTGRINDIGFSPNGFRILTTSEDGTARTWDATNGKLLRIFSGHGKAIYKGAFSPDQRLIALASEDQTVWVWSADSGQVIRAMRGHTGATFDVAFSPDNERLVAGSADRTATMWNVASGQLMTTFYDTRGIYKVAFSPDGQRVVTIGENVRLWNANDGQLRATFRPQGQYSVKYIGLSPDTRRIVTGGEDGTLEVYRFVELSDISHVRKQFCLFPCWH